MSNQQPTPAATGLPPFGTLSALPIELLTNILVLSSQHDTTIKPEQWLPGSAEFVVDTPFTRYLAHSMRDAHSPNEPLPRALTALSLQRVCKAIHEVVDGGKMFHKLNNFEFHNWKSVLTYIVALPAEPRKAITTITVRYDPSDSAAHAITGLSTCDNLKNLTLDISFMSQFFNGETGFDGFWNAPGVTELLNLRGMKRVKLIYEESNDFDFPKRVIEGVRQVVCTDQAKEDFRADVKRLEQRINNSVTLDRNGPFIFLTDIPVAVSHIDVTTLGKARPMVFVTPPIIVSSLSSVSADGNAQTTDQSVESDPWISQTSDWSDIDEVAEDPWTTQDPAPSSW
jgi:hypothetical protein